VYSPLHAIGLAGRSVTLSILVDPATSVRHADHVLQDTITSDIPKFPSTTLFITDKLPKTLHQTVLDCATNVGLQVRSRLDLGLDLHEAFLTDRSDISCITATVARVTPT